MQTTEEGNKIITEYLGWRFDIDGDHVEAFYNGEARWIDMVVGSYNIINLSSEEWHSKS